MLSPFHPNNLMSHSGINFISPSLFYKERLNICNFPAQGTPFPNQKSRTTFYKGNTVNYERTNKT